MKKTSFYFMIVLIWICGKIIFKNQFYNFHIIIQLSKYKKLTGWLCNYSGWHGLITTGFPEWLRLKLRQKQKKTLNHCLGNSVVIKSDPDWFI